MSIKDGFNLWLGKTLAEILLFVVVMSVFIGCIALFFHGAKKGWW